MKNTVFEIVKNGLFKEVSAPVYGKQDVGITPGGAMDRFSFQVGNILLGNPADSPAFEIVIAPKFRFKRDCYFVLTGAEYKKVTLTEDSNQAVAVETSHGTVCFAPSGSTLKFGRKIYGFRTYLCYTPVDGSGEDILGRSWNEFRSVCDCTDSNRKVRVLEGPEYEYLNDPDPFLNNTWETTRDISEMGMRLASSGEMPSVSVKNMVSEAVSDGTIQLTPNGPIVLLRHRQTVGGYPRIFNVISADMDLLGQYSAKKTIRFEKVALDEAMKAANQKRCEVQTVRDKISR